MASIDSIIASAQSMAMTAASNATAMYNAAISAAELSHTVNFKAVDEISTIDDLSYANAPEFEAAFSAPDVDNLTLDVDYAAAVAEQRSPMKAFVAGGMQDWITSFAPNYLASQAELEAKITDGMAGGSAISDAVEQAIFDRARDRVDAENSAVQAQLAASMAKRGFPLPSGILAAGLRQVQKDSADRIARSATETAIKRAEIENEFARECVKASQSLNQGVQGSITTYAGIVATVNEATLRYASAIVAAIEANIKSKLPVALAQFEAEDTSFKNTLATLQTNVGNLAKKLEMQINKAGMLLDQAKAQTSADVQLEQVKAEVAMNKVRNIVAAANSGAGPQASIASAAISSQNTLVQQQEE